MYLEMNKYMPACVIKVGQLLYTCMYTHLSYIEAIFCDKCQSEQKERFFDVSNVILHAQ